MLFSFVLIAAVCATPSNAIQDAIIEIYGNPDSILQVLPILNLSDLLENLPILGSEVSAVVLNTLHKKLSSKLVETLKEKDLEFLINVNREQNYYAINLLIDAVNTHVELDENLQEKMISLLQDFLLETNDKETADKSINLLDRLIKASDSLFVVDALFLMWLSEKVSGMKKDNFERTYLNVFFKSLNASDESALKDADIELGVVVSKVLELVEFEDLKESLNIKLSLKGLLLAFKESNFTAALSSEKCMEYIIDIYCEQSLGEIEIQSIVDGIASIELLDTLVDLSKRFIRKKDKIQSLVALLLQNMKVEDALVNIQKVNLTNPKWFQESKQLKMAMETFLLNAINVSLRAELEYSLYDLLKEFSGRNDGFKEKLFAMSDKPIYVAAVLPNLPESLFEKLSSFESVEIMLLAIVNSLQTSEDAKLSLTFLDSAKDYLKFRTSVIKELALKNYIAIIEKAAKEENHYFGFVLYILEQQTDSIVFFEDADWLVEEIQNESVVKPEHLVLLTKLIELDPSLVSKFDQIYISAVLEMKVSQKIDNIVSKFIAFIYKASPSALTGPQVLEWMIKKHKIEGAIKLLGQDHVFDIMKEEFFEIVAKKSHLLLAKLDELWQLILRMDSSTQELKLRELATVPVLKTLHETILKFKHGNKVATNRLYTLLEHADFKVTMVEVVKAMHLENADSVFRVNWDEKHLVAELMGSIDSERGSLSLLMEFYFIGINGRPLEASSCLRILDSLNYENLEELVKSLPAEGIAQLYADMNFSSKDFFGLLLQHNQIGAIINKDNCASVINECISHLEDAEPNIQYRAMNSLVQLFLIRNNSLVDFLKTYGKVIQDSLNLSTIKSTIERAKQIDNGMNLNLTLVKYLVALYDSTTESDMQIALLDYIIEENYVALATSKYVYIPYVPRLIARYSTDERLDELLQASWHSVIKSIVPNANGRLAKLFVESNLTEEVVSFLKRMVGHISSLVEIRQMSFLTIGYVFQQEQNRFPYWNTQEIAAFLASKAYWYQMFVDRVNNKKIDIVKMDVGTKGGHLKWLAILFYPLKDKKELFQAIADNWDKVELPEGMAQDEKTKRKFAKNLAETFDLSDAEYKHNVDLLNSFTKRLQLQ